MTGELARDWERARAAARAAGWDPTWIRTAADARATLRGCRFDASAAQHVRSFGERFLRHSKGAWAGKPFQWLPWQWDQVIAPLFGWRRADGTRRFRRAYVSCAKKNGKSELAAAVGLYLLVADSEPSPEVFIAARDRWQAGIVFEMGRRMVAQSPELARHLDIVESRKVIAYPAAFGKLEALSSDAPKTEGVSISGLIFDELHVADRALFDALEHGGAARRQPLTLMVTTAGLHDPAALGFEQYAYAKGVLDGTRDDDAFFAAIWEAPADLALDSEPAIRAANPSLGVTVQLPEVQAAARAAADIPSRRATYERYRLNRWVAPGATWVSLEAWDRAAGHAVPESWDGRTVWGGLDLASVSDLSALAWVSVCPDDPRAVDVHVRAWLPEDAVARSKHRALFEQWREAGLLEVTPGPVVDYGRIVAAIEADAQRMHVAAIAVDRLFQGLHVAQALDDVGLPVTSVGMGFRSLGPLMRELDGLIKGGRLHHGGAPVLRWCVGNLLVTTDAAGLTKPDRARSADKIDAVVATLLALDGWLRRSTVVAPVEEWDGSLFVID